MNKQEKIYFIIATVVSVTLFSVLIVCFLGVDVTSDIVSKEPGLDNKPINLGKRGEKVTIGEFFTEYEGSASKNFSENWPVFRGANLDNIYKGNVKLADNWGEDGPKELWSIDLGKGYAAPAVWGGVVYLLDYDEKEQADALRCFSMDDGREIWRRWYRIKIKQNHGMSRTIPAVNDKYVVTIGPKCHVMCVEQGSGKYLWGIDMVNEYGSKTPLWYTGQCPIIVGDQVILAPVGTDVLMMGVDLKTGKVVWSVPNKGEWQMSHSSITPMTFCGKKMLIYSAQGGIAGVSADNEDFGELLWSSNIWNNSVVAPSPVKISNDQLFITSGYGAGGMSIKIIKKSSKYEVKAVQILKSKEGLACEQQTPLYLNGFLYGVLPKDAGARRMQFVCYNEKDLSIPVWSSGKTERFGIGPFIIADKKIYIMGDDGELTMARLSEEKFIKLDCANVLHGHDAWGPLAIVNGRMLCRDFTRIVCLDLREDKE